jgi:VWFA-related protein
MSLKAASVLLVALPIVPLLAATRMIVTVTEQKTGKPVTDLKAADFSVTDDKASRGVEGAEFNSEPIDVMLLLDTSLVGEAVKPVANGLIAQLGEKEQMAIVSFHSSADLIQQFTSSRELLSRAIANVSYGNSPRVLDALFATIEGGFENTGFRRVILLLTTGFEGPSRVGFKDVIRLARRNQVSIFPVYVTGYGRSLLEDLAKQTGGASFNLRDMQKTTRENPAPRIFEVLRSRYVMTLSGNLSPSDKLKIEAKRAEKLFISALPLE